MQAKLEDILSGAVEIPAGQYKVITGNFDYVFTADDSVGADLWRRMSMPGFGYAFNRLWPASCDWTVEWEQEEGECESEQ